MMSNLKVPNEIWCRTCGYYRPVAQMSHGKRSEFDDRVNYKLPDLFNPVSEETGLKVG